MNPASVAPLQCAALYPWRGRQLRCQAHTSAEHEHFHVGAGQTVTWVTARRLA